MNVATTIKAYNDEGQPAGERPAAEALWTGEISPAAVHATVVWQQARRRSGTHATKNRREVSGGGIKPFKQKGTGRARQGSIRSAQMRHGGRAFGPKPRDYDYALPKQVRALALKSVLRQRYADGMVAVWDAVAPLEKPSAKAVVKFLTGFRPVGKVALVTAAADETRRRSARNLPGVTPLAVAGLNVYDLVHADQLVLTGAALAELEAAR